MRKRDKVILYLCSIAVVAGALARVVCAQSADNGTRIESGIYRGQHVTYAVVNGRNIYEGDIILEKVDPRFEAGESSGAGSEENRRIEPSVGVAYLNYLWPSVSGVHQIPYIVTNGATNLSTALSQFNSTFTGLLEFVPWTNQADYVNFDFDSNNLNGICESSVGRIGGEQEVSGSVACSVGTLLHEFGHVIGLWHEQSRSDRNSYVTYLYNNVIKGSAINFDQLQDNAQNLTLYDYGSVMHYIPFAFSANGGPTLESIPPGIPLSNATGYTATDIDGITRLYSKAPTSVTVTTNPPGLQVIVDGSTVTTPKTFKWALNSKHTLNVSANAQTQNGTTYIYGRWNDNSAASHQITVAPGNNMESQPATSPAVTVYTANFIELVGFVSSVYPANSGTMTESPQPMTVTGAQGQFYTVREQVTFTATPNSGYNFYSFSSYLPGAVSSNPKTEYMESMPPSTTVQALFSSQQVTTISSNPGDVGVGVVIDNNAFWYTPKNFSPAYDSGWTAGSVHTLSMATPQQPYSVNTRYTFESWSDGGDATHQITVPSGNSVFTATMEPQFVPVYYANEGCAGNISVSPMSSDGFYNTGTQLTFTETPESGWIFTEWQNDLNGQNNPQNLTLNSEVLVTADYNTTATPLTLTALAPPNATVGGAGFTLTLTGTGFTNSTNVYINGNYRASTFISSTMITVPILATDITAGGAFQVGVQNFPNGAVCAAFAPMTFSVLLAPTTTALASSANPASYGEPVALTATVTPSTSGVPTGTVSFQVGTTVLGTIALNSSGQATLNAAGSKVKVGTYNIVAVYSGDTNYVGSMSATLHEVVNKASTSATVASSLNPSNFGQAVTFTAKITPQFTGTPSGSVMFDDGQTAIGSGKLNAKGVATFTTSTLARGSHSITAVYPGDTNFTGSTSPVLTQVVN